MKFHKILEDLLDGFSFARKHSDYYVKLVDEKPYCFYSNEKKKLWNPTWDDLIADDWSIIRAKEIKNEN